jgi:hypothetical protein
MACHLRGPATEVTLGKLDGDRAFLSLGPGATTMLALLAGSPLENFGETLH